MVKLQNQVHSYYSTCWLDQGLRREKAQDMYILICNEIYCLTFIITWLPFVVLEKQGQGIENACNFAKTPENFIACTLLQYKH